MSERTNDGAGRGAPAKVWLAAATATWVVAAVAGSVWLAAYKSAPGAPAQAPATWPVDTAFTLAPDKPTLLMLAHPRCTCTRASLTELSTLLERVGPAVDAHVVFLRPDGMDDAWVHSDTFAAASAIPGVHVSIDDGGRETAKLGVAVSGQVVVYAPSGALLFAGGITGSRGHVGDNPGLDRLTAVLSGGAPELRSAPVFGCDLQEAAAAAAAPPASSTMSRPASRSTDG